MPKVIYSAGKGLYQTTGSGFQVNDVAILEEVQALTDPSAATVNPYGITTLTKTGACTATLAAPTSSEPAGAKKVLSMIAASGGGVCLVTLTGGGIQDDGATALASLSSLAIFTISLAIDNILLFSFLISFCLDNETLSISACCSFIERVLWVNPYCCLNSVVTLPSVSACKEVR